MYSKMFRSLFWGVGGWSPAGFGTPTQKSTKMLPVKNYNGAKKVTYDGQLRPIIVKWNIVLAVVKKDKYTSAVWPILVIQIFLQA